jgi:hypothetical protein
VVGKGRILHGDFTVCCCGRGCDAMVRDLGGSMGSGRGKVLCGCDAAAATLGNGYP